MKSSYGAIYCPHGFTQSTRCYSPRCNRAGGRDRDAGHRSGRESGTLARVEDFQFRGIQGSSRSGLIQRIASPNPPRRRRPRELTDDEIRAVWETVEEEPRDIAALFRLLLLTGQWRGEMVGMRWLEIDLQSGWWELPASRTKNGRLHRVPIVGRALEIVRLLDQDRRDAELVFPGLRAGRPLVNLVKPLARVIKQARLAQFTLHDLRRTTASRLGRARVAPHVIAKLLNHITGTGVSRITQIYNRYEYNAEKRAALIKWNRDLTVILAGAKPASNVVELRA